MSTDSGDGDVSISSDNSEKIETNDDSSGCRPCEPLKILKFVECLSASTNSIEMQILVNKYVSIKIASLRNLLSTEISLLLFVYDNKKEMFLNLKRF